jgi:hypothetical protein
MVEEEGMTLMGAAAKSGVPYATVAWHSRMECWNPPGGKKIGRPRDIGILEAQARRIEAEVARQDALLAAEAALVKGADLEVLCRKSLVADRARLKVAISRKAAEIVSRLDDPAIPVRIAAQTLGTLAPILRLLYGWDRELAIGEMQRAQSGMINLALQATPPTALKELALAQQSADALETEHNGQRNGTGCEQREGPPAGPDGHESPEKEALGEALKDTQPARTGHPTRREKPELDAILRPQLPFPSESQTDKDGPQERRMHQLENLARLRAEWRKRR